MTRTTSRERKAWSALDDARVYTLAHVLETGIPHHSSDPPFAFSLTKLHGDYVHQDGVSAAGDLFVLGGHVGTHIDAVSHFSKDGRIHGGVEVGLHQSMKDGISIGSVEQMPPLVATAHLVDVPLLLGRAVTVRDGIGAAEFEAWFEERVAPQAGEVVLVRTGWDAHWGDPPAFLGTETGLPGLTLSGANWLAARNVVAVGSDTPAVEMMPSPALEVHVHLLVEAGIPLLKSLRLSELAEDAVYECLLVVAPLPVRGATGSPVQPLAIVGGRDDE